MKKIEAYKCSDGTIYEDMSSAEMHEGTINLNESLKDLLNEITEKDDETIDDIAEALTKNAQRLYRIMYGYNAILENVQISKQS